MSVEANRKTIETLWSALSQAGETDPLPGYGRLLAEPRADRRKKATSAA